MRPAATTGARARVWACGWG